MSKHIHSIKKGAPVALVGGESLLGRELREVVEGKAVPAQIKLIATSDEGMILTENAGEPVLMASMQAEELSTAKVVLLAGSVESSRKAYELIQGRTPKPLFIDATGALEDSPQSRLRAPMLETERPEPAPIQVVAHPAAISLALFLRRLVTLGPVRRCIAVVFEPASERGQPGLDELQQQTVGLLSFQKLKKNVFDAQVSFNLLPQLGEDAPRQLEEVEHHIERHLASLISTAGLPMPSLRLVQAPVFHGYSFSVWVEFEKNAGAEAIAKALKSDHIEVRTKNEEAPSNVGAAGQSGITVGAITNDRNDPRACWFWIVADNLRITAENAVEVARELLE